MYVYIVSNISLTTQNEMFMQIFSSVTVDEDFTTIFFTMKYITFNSQLSTPPSLGLSVL